MTIAMASMVPWIATAAVIVFLTVCVWHNRRTGYQSEPIEKIQLGEALILIKQSLTWKDAPPDSALFTSIHTDQLISLNSALQNRQQVAPYQANEVEAPVEAEANVADESTVRS
jgi:hypothetical protein